MNYTIISGTNRPKSNSLIISNHYHKLFLEKNENCEIIDLEKLPHSFIYTDMYGKRSPEFQRIQEIVNKTDKFIFVIPEYNGSFPGVLKAFIDACQFPQSFAGKKCMLSGISSGKFGNLRGLSHFSGIANYIKMDVYHNKIYLPGIENEINENGELKNEQNRLLIQKQIEGFINF